MSMNMREVARALSGEPWAVDLRRLNALADFVGRHLRAGTEPTADELPSIRAAMGMPAPIGARQANGVGVIPIHGFLLPHASPLAEFLGAVGYDRIGAEFDAMLASPDVGSIVLDADTGGGSVYGATELAARIFAARGQKRIVAVANAFMCSAGYWICAGADEIVGAPSSETGSLGVYAVHVDWSEMDAKDGIKRTVISAGKFKAEAVPGMPLTDEAQAAMQERVEEVYDALVRDVARGRGVTPAAVKAGYGEGRALGAKKAKEAGLIDRIGTLEEVIGKLLPKAPRATGKRAEFERQRLALDIARLM